MRVTYEDLLDHAATRLYDADHLAREVVDALARGADAVEQRTLAVQQGRYLLAFLYACAVQLHE